MLLTSGMPWEPSDRFNFLYPRSRYYGQVKPENLVFNTNFREFAIAVGYIANLEISGKLSPEEAYNQIKALWKQLKRSKKELGIGSDARLDPDSSDG